MKEPCFSFLHIARYYWFKRNEALDHNYWREANRCKDLATTYSDACMPHPLRRRLGLIPDLKDQVVSDRTLQRSTGPTRICIAGEDIVLDLHKEN